MKSNDITINSNFDKNFFANIHKQNSQTIPKSLKAMKGNSQTKRLVEKIDNDKFLKGCC